MIRLGLDQPEVRAFVLVMGQISLLPTDQAKRRVLTFVSDFLMNVITPNLLITRVPKKARI